MVREKGMVAHKDFPVARKIGAQPMNLLQGLPEPRRGGTFVVP